MPHSNISTTADLSDQSSNNGSPALSSVHTFSHAPSKPSHPRAKAAVPQSKLRYLESHRDHRLDYQRQYQAAKRATARQRKLEALERVRRWREKKARGDDPSDHCNDSMDNLPPDPLKMLADVALELGGDSWG
ncbi:hypothetical protein CALCODRAFT_485656 [Calocera cornea HHB12733]|uniref:Uncharacterized protein n=1 Tax=Calocera cornea HHB12733 TaxID=1353952 RepID=A0A165E997_9BASI|nr:hypothetical protein CALCODRAFT_488504 [Calocera cornea HHB12733]KZT54373.1 hypothetical protein CALCODRAFT_485656 [Calocera cornea HHB12733]